MDTNLITSKDNETRFRTTLSKYNREISENRKMMRETFVYEHPENNDLINMNECRNTLDQLFGSFHNARINLSKVKN